MRFRAKTVAWTALLGCTMPAVGQIIWGNSKNMRLNYRGEAAIEQWVFPRAAPSASQPDAVTTMRAQLDLALQPPWPLEFRFNPRLVWDPQNGDRSRLFALNDLYLDWFTPRFEIRAGWQIFSWKTVESVSHADFLNQKDYEVDFFDADKMGELSLRLRVQLPWGGEPWLEGYYLPWFQPALFPRSGNRYDFLAAAAPLPDGRTPRLSNVHPQYQSSRGEWRPQGALRYKAMAFEAVDWTMFYFNGYDRFPGLRLDFASAELRHLYRPVHRAGLTFQGALGSWLVKGEFLGNRFEKKLPVRDPVTNAEFYREFDPYLAYTTGFEYTFYSPWMQNHDLGAILEIMGDTDTGKDPAELEGFRPFQNHVFAGLRYTFNNTGDRALLVGTFVDYRRGDFIARGEYEERFFRHFKAKIRAAGIGTGSDGSQLRNFEHAVRGDAEIGYFF